MGADSAIRVSYRERLCSAITKRIIYTLSGLLLVVCSGGCKTAGDAPQQLTQFVPATAGSILDQIDPTGVRAANEAVQKAAASLSEKLDLLDAAELNTSIRRLNELLDGLTVHVENWPTDLGKTFESELRAAQIEERSRQLKNLLTLAQDELSGLDAAGLHAAVLQVQQDVRETAERFEERIDSINIARINEIIARSKGLEQKYLDVMEQTVQVEQKIMRTLDQLPIAQVQATADELQRTAASASQVIQDLRVTLWLIDALLAVLICCGIVWMVRRAKH